MKVSIDKFAELIIKRSEMVDVSNLSLNIHLANIFWALDGTRTVQAIARQENYELQDLIKNISLLIEKGMVYVSDIGDIVDQVRMDSIKENLARIVGPVASIILENTICEMDRQVTTFPVHEIDRLVDLIAEKIKPDDKAKEFKQSMTNL
jgi:hypothetical protein